MSVEEAEEVVEKLGQSGILKLEEGIVDATTEEGKKFLENLEAEGKREPTEPAAVTQKEEVEEIGDPE
jgi:cell division cycle protein 37